MGQVCNALLRLCSCLDSVCHRICDIITNEFVWFYFFFIAFVTSVQYLYHVFFDWGVFFWRGTRFRIYRVCVGGGVDWAEKIHPPSEMESVHLGVVEGNSLFRRFLCCNVFIICIS